MADLSECNCKADRSLIMPRKSSAKARNKRSPSGDRDDASDSDTDYQVQSPSTPRTRSSRDTSSEQVDLSGDDTHNTSRDRSNLSVGSGVRSRSNLHVTPSSLSSDSRLYPDLSGGDSPSPLSKTPESRKAKSRGIYPTDDLKELNAESPDTDSSFIKRERRYQHRRKSEGMEDKQEASPDYTNYLIYPLAFVFLFVILGRYLLASSEKSESSDASLGKYEQYLSGINELEKSFPNQPPRLWRTFKSSARHVLNATNPEYPVVILMAANSGNSLVAECLAAKIALLFDSTSKGVRSTQHSSSDVAGYNSLSDADQKKRLDADLNSAYSKNGRKSFVIKNLQLLAPEASLILHGYCDNDNAPYKNVMLLMTIYVDDTAVNLDSHKPANYEGVETYLKKLWGRGLVTDKVDALMSRVANNIVVVAAANDNDMKKVCF